MKWGKFLCNIALVGFLYAITLIIAHLVYGKPWHLVGYFIALKDISLIVLVLQGIEAVRMANELRIPVPGWLKWCNGLILIVAVVAGIFSMLKIINYVPNEQNLGGFSDLINWGIIYSTILCIVPLFLYTLLNMFVITWPTVDSTLRERITKYFVFSDLTCAIPATGLVVLVWLVDGFYTADADTVLAIGAGTLIFVSNTASFAVNEWDTP